MLHLECIQRRRLKMTGCVVLWSHRPLYIHVFHEICVIFKEMISQCQSYILFHSLFKSIHGYFLEYTSPIGHISSQFGSGWVNLSPLDAIRWGLRSCVLEALIEYNVKRRKFCLLYQGNN